MTTDPHLLELRARIQDTPRGIAIVRELAVEEAYPPAFALEGTRVTLPDRRALIHRSTAVLDREASALGSTSWMWINASLAGGPPPTGAMAPVGAALFSDLGTRAADLFAQRSHEDW